MSLDHCTRPELQNSRPKNRTNFVGLRSDLERLIREDIPFKKKNVHARSFLTEIYIYIFNVTLESQRPRP